MKARKTERKVVLSEEDQETARIVGTYQLCDGNAAETARQLGIDRRTVRRHVDRASRRGLSGTAPAPLPTGRHIERMTEEYARHPETGEWIPTRTWAKSKADGPTEFAPETFAEILRAAWADVPTAPPPPPVPVAPEAEDLCVLFPWADLHLGRKSWAKQCGQDWDLRIAADTFRRVDGEVIACAPPAAEAVLLGLGDLTEADDDSDLTPASGHKQDVDTRHEKTTEAALSLILWKVRALRAKYPRVRVVILPGNHDERTARMIRVALRFIFADDPAVIVESLPSVYWFFRWGNVYLAAHHGHNKMTPEKLVGVMATDRRALWSACDFRYAHMGHLHHLWAKEEWQTLVEGHRSPAAPNRYDNEAAHRSGRDLKAIVYHREEGEKARVIAAIPPTPAPTSDPEEVLPCFKTHRAE